MPRKPRRPLPARLGPSDQLREIIRSRDVTCYALGRDAGVDPGMIQRFLNHERDIRMDTFDRIAAVLRVRLVEVGLPTRRGRPAPPAPEDTPPATSPDVDETDADGTL